MKQIFGICFLILLGAAADAAYNASQWQAGYEQARAEFFSAKSEHDRIMQQVGLCKWAKIWADHTRCQSELP